MTRFNRNVAFTLAAAVLTLAAAPPASALVDEQGNVLAVIVTADGRTLY